MTTLDELLNWYEHLSTANVADVAVHYHPQARFKDPFNEVEGHTAIRRIFEHMFESTDNPHFKIRSRMRVGDEAFVTWLFHFGLKGKAYTVEGASHLYFDEQGRVLLHRDYWDPAEELWQKLPLIGRPVRWLRRRFKAN